MNNMNDVVFIVVDIPYILEKDVDYGEGSFKHTFDLQATSILFLVYSNNSICYYYCYRCNGC